MSNITLLFLSIMSVFLAIIAIISCCFAQLNLKIVSEHEGQKEDRKERASFEDKNLNYRCSITAHNSQVTVEPLIANSRIYTVEVHNVPDHARIL